MWNLNLVKQHNKKNKIKVVTSYSSHETKKHKHVITIDMQLKTAAATDDDKWDNLDNISIGAISIQAECVFVVQLKSLRYEDSTIEWIGSKSD